MVVKPLCTFAHAQGEKAPSVAPTSQAKSLDPNHHHELSTWRIQAPIEAEIASTFEQACAKTLSYDQAGKAEKKTGQDKAKHLECSQHFLKLLGTLVNFEPHRFECRDNFGQLSGSADIDEQCRERRWWWLNRPTSLEA